MKIFNNFSDFHQLQSSQRNYLNFSDIQSTLGNTMVRFSKNPSQNILAKPIESPYFTVFWQINQVLTGYFDELNNRSLIDLKLSYFVCHFVDLKFRRICISSIYLKWQCEWICCKLIIDKITNIFLSKALNTLISYPYIMNWSLPGDAHLPKSPRKK